MELHLPGKCGTFTLATAGLLCKAVLPKRMIFACKQAQDFDSLEIVGARFGAADPRRFLRGRRNILYT